MVFEETNITPRGARAFIARTYSLGLDFNKNDWALSGKKGMKAPKEGHHLNKVGPKVK
jgi:hypothetical protein